MPMPVGGVVVYVIKHLKVHVKQMIGPTRNLAPSPTFVAYQMIQTFSTNIDWKAVIGADANP